MSVLHERFVAEIGEDCHYSTFTRNVPSYVIKPKPSDWGTCLCKTCLNPELKIERLNELDHLKVKNLESTVRNDTLKNELIEKLRLETTHVTNVEWNLTKEGEEKNFTSGSRRLTWVVENPSMELTRKLSTKSKEKPRSVTLQIDWSENAKLFQT